MLQLSFAARITLIVAVGLIAAWIGLIGLLYRLQDLEREGFRPSPHEIAAIVALVERTPPGQRQLVLDAVSSRILRARLTVEGMVDAAIGSVDRAARQDYASALGERRFVLVPSSDSAIRWRLPRPFAAVADGLEFRVQLRTGKTLVIDARSPIAVTEVGLPLGLGAGLLGTLIALAALVVLHWQARPLARLAAAVDRMDLAGDPAPMPQSRASAPEIQILVQSFDRLQGRLFQLLRARMAMLGGISHDVRTFATRLRLRVDQIPDGIERDRAIGDIADIIRLLDDALLASRAGAGELAEELVEFDEIVRAEVEDKQATGAAIDLRLGRNVAGATVLGDRLALRRVVSNLAGNALSYGRVAHLSLDVEPRILVLFVDDEGAGIPRHLREILLEPFVRLESSRSRRTGGAGLGLAVVRNLVEAHRGTIAIEDAPTGGARFVVRLPLFAAS